MVPMNLNIGFQDFSNVTTEEEEEEKQENKDNDDAGV